MIYDSNFRTAAVKELETIEESPKPKRASRKGAQEPEAVDKKPEVDAETSEVPEKPKRASRKAATVATAAVQPPKDGRRKARREPEVKVEPKAVTFEATETEEPELDKSPVKETAKPAKTSRKTKATEIIEKVCFYACIFDLDFAKSGSSTLFC